MLVSISGPEFSFGPGDVVTVPKGESAARWIEAGIAEPVESKKKPKPGSRKKAGK